MKEKVCSWLMMISAALVLSACASQSPTNYYSLQVRTDPSVEISLPDSVTLGIGPVSLPSELDRPGLVTQLRGSGIDIAPYHIWAGDLDENFSRVLAGLMAEHLQVDQVYAAPWDTRFRPEYQLRVDVQRFSGTLGGEVYMDVLWTLTSKQGRHKLHGERSKLQLSSEGSSYLDYVDALNRLMSHFSTAVAARMEQLLAAANNAEPSGE